MANTTKTISITLRPQILKAIDAAARNERRSRSQFIDLTMASALTGQQQRQAEPAAYSDSENPKL
jgi:metal-responsive CopG/Arc/MetJ family transcriptional regulator